MRQAAGMKGKEEVITGDVLIDRINLLGRLGRIDRINFLNHLDNVDQMSLQEHRSRVDLIAHLAERIGLAAIIPASSFWGKEWGVGYGTWGNAEFFLKKLIDRQRAADCTAMPVVWVEDGNQYVPGPAFRKADVDEVIAKRPLLFPCRCDKCAALRTNMGEVAGIEVRK